MKKKLLMVLISVSMIASVFTGCGNSTETKDSGKAQTEQADTKEDSADKAEDEQAALEDGTYTAEFQTDSSMSVWCLKILSICSKELPRMHRRTAQNCFSLQQILLITAMEHLMRSMDSTFRFRHWTKNLILH